MDAVLNKIEKRTVLAVYAEQQRLIGELREVDAALTELVETYRQAHGLPDGVYVFHGDGGEIRIMEQPQAQEA